MGYTIRRQGELEWVPRGDDDPRTVARLSDAMSRGGGQPRGRPRGDKEGKDTAEKKKKNTKENNGVGVD